MKKFNLLSLWITLLLLFFNSVCFAGFKKGIHLGYVRGIGLNYTFYKYGYTDDLLVDYYFGVIPFIDLAGGIYYKLENLDKSDLNSRLDLSLRLHAMLITDGNIGTSGIGFEPGLSIGSGEFRAEFGVIITYTNKIGFLPNIGFIYKYDRRLFDIHVPYLP